MLGGGLFEDENLRIILKPTVKYGNNHRIV
jgi:hypothetical protein